MKRNTVVCLLTSILIGLATWSSSYGQEMAQVRSQPAGLQARQAVPYGRLPLSFEVNKGQVSPQARYLARGQGFTLFLTQADAILQLTKFMPDDPAVEATASGLKNAQTEAASPGAADVLRLKLLGANHQARITVSERLPGNTSYFLGNDPQKWLTNVPNYARVRYRQIYPGIDLAYYGRQGQLESDFLVAPGSDSKLIRLGVEGARKVRSNASGDLVLTVSDGEVYLRRPLAFQGNGASRRQVAVRYSLQAGNRVGFALGPYDHHEELVIDPVLSYSTYLGGSGGDDGLGIAVDAAGDAYVTGTTASVNFPKTGGQANLGGGKDIFVAKLNPSGSAFLYSVFLGGGNLDRATSIAIDSSGNAYLAGYTTSTDFPTTSGAYQASNAGSTDAFLAKLDPTGASLVYSSYLGGSGIDYGRGVAVDSSGDAFITGSTQSTNFPTVKPLQVGLDGGSDAFVAEFDPTGASLLYSTYLGGSGADEALAIALDGSGNPYVAGYTFSSNFPTQSALQSSLSGASDAFVTEINPATSSLVFSTYLGGSASESAQSIAIDSAGSIYVTGSTSSSSFPVTSGASQAAYGGGGTDAFVTKLAPGGAQMVYSTFLGGSGLDQGNSIAIDSSGDAFVTGFTQSSDLPLTNALQRVLGVSGAGSCGAIPCDDAFVTELGPSGNVAFSTFLGGSATDFGQAIATDPSGAAYLTGSTSSTNFPVIAGAPQSTYAGTNQSNNVFIAKVSPQDAPAAALSPQTLNFGNQVINHASSPQAVTLVNAGSAPLGITSISASGQFIQTNDCGSVVPAGGGTCTIQVTFTPTQTGSVTDQITITDNAAGSPQAITVTGGGVTSAGTLSISATSLTFAAQTVGQASPAQTVQLTNTGNTAINISNITTSGDFAQTTSCGTLPTVLNVGASCSISVTFTPASTGSRTGSLTIDDDANDNPQGVSLTGTGNAVFTLSSNVRSSVVLIGTTSATFTVAAAAPSTFQGAINLACTAGTCAFNPTFIYAGQSSTVTVSGLSATTANPFDFSVKGTSSGQDTTVAVTVFFADFTLSQTPPSPALRTVTAGDATTYTVTVTPINGFNQVVLLGCTNLPQGSDATAQNPDTTCTYSPPGLALDGIHPSTATLTISTTAQTSSHLLPRPPGGMPPWGQVNFRWWNCVLAFFMIFAALFALGRRRRSGQTPARLWAGIAVLAMAVSLGALATACNDTVVGPTTTPVTTGTPAGTYTITIVGTLGSDGSIKRTATVNLAVAP